MKFGYFTLSDNTYPNNPLSPEQSLIEIRDQAVLAEKLGLNSAWIGEHHFNRRGCVSVPAVVLANIAAATTRLRLSPAPRVRPSHPPLHPARLRVSARSGAGQYRRCHDALAACPRRRRAADPPPDPRRGGMGDA